MAQQKNTKLKLLYLSDILSEKTDEAHPLSANELCDALCAAGIEAERKSVYKDIEVLKEYGLDIILGTENNKRGYFIGARKFELAELRLLLDAVQAANFISQKKTKILVEKIESFASKYRRQRFTDRYMSITARSAKTKSFITQFRRSTTPSTQSLKCHSHIQGALSPTNLSKKAMKKRLK